MYGLERTVRPSDLLDNFRVFQREQEKYRNAPTFGQRVSLKREAYSESKMLMPQRLAAFIK